MADKPVIGIDLGTTNSVVSYPTREGDKISIDYIKNVDGEILTPSFIYVGRNNKYVVGDQAKAKMSTDPSRIISSYKPFIGDNTELKNINDRSINSFTATSIALKYMKKGIDKQFPNGIEGVVITVPAYFNENQKSATSKAAESAGLRVMGIITEPAASAFCYMHDRKIKEDGETVLVYDIGGGTFDVSILYLTEDGFATVLAIGGDRFLGGDDFDAYLSKYVINNYLSRNKLTVNQEKIIIRACEKAKVEMMSNFEEHATYTIDISDAKISGKDKIEITTDEFFDITKDLVKNTIDITNNTLTDAGLTVADIDELILVGGSSRLVNIKMALEEFTNKKFNLLREKPYVVQPDFSVSFGASIYAKLLQDRERDKITEILSKDFGIADNTGKMITLLTKGSAIPCRSSRAVTNPDADQKILSILIYEGNSEYVEDNNMISELIIDLPKGIKERELELVVKFNIDEDGILSVNTIGDYEDELKVDLRKSGSNYSEESDDTIVNAEFSNDINEADWGDLESDDEDEPTEPLENNDDEDDGEVDENDPLGIKWDTK